MTTERRQRCKHCGILYAHVTSGWKPDKSSGDHCGECNVAIQKAIKAALKDIPAKFVKEYVLTEDVTLEQLLEWENLNNEEAKARRVQEGGFLAGLDVRRVSFNMMDTEDPDNRNCCATVQGRDKFARRVFTYSYWTKGKHPTEIKEECERNVATGQLCPWAF